MSLFERCNPSPTISLPVKRERKSQFHELPRVGLESKELDTLSFKYGLVSILVIPMITNVLLSTAYHDSQLLLILRTN